MSGAPKMQEWRDDQRLISVLLHLPRSQRSAARSAPQTEMPPCSQQLQRAAQQHREPRSRSGTHGLFGQVG